MKDTIFNALVIIGMLLIATGVVMPLVTMDIDNDLFRYIYASGAGLLLVGRLFTASDSNNLRVKRLYRLQTWSALFLCAAAFFMFWDKSNMRDPVALTLAGAIIQIYTSVMIPRAEK